MLGMLQRIKLYKELNPNELTPQQFKLLEKEIKEPEDLISDEYLDFKLWSRGLPSRQELFASFIEKKLERYAKVLEVGCGRTGRLSRILSTKGFEMTAIDPKLEVQSDANIEFIKGKFNYKEIDLTKYDYVIAQEPCDATEHIVRACIAQNKPFIVSLCATPHKLISGEMPKDVHKWWDYLVSIDSSKVRLRYISLDPLTNTPILKSCF